MKKQLNVDFALITKKKDSESDILIKVRQLNEYCNAVPEKENKRNMNKWKPLCNLEREFEKLDQKWEHTKYFIYQDFKFPDDQFSIDLDAVRDYTRSVGHYIDKWKFEALMEPSNTEKLRD